MAMIRGRVREFGMSVREGWLLSRSSGVRREEGNRIVLIRDFGCWNRSEWRTSEVIMLEGNLEIVDLRGTVGSWRIRR